jgi:hypothetical protein
MFFVLIRNECSQSAFAAVRGKAAIINSSKPVAVRFCGVARAAP